MSCSPIPTSLGWLPQYSHRDEACEETADPVNVVFAGLSAADVSRLLSGNENGLTGKRWRETRWTASNQYSGAAGCSRQAIQLVAGGIWSRLHMRLWDQPLEHRSGCVGAAHREYGLTLGAGLHDALHHPTSFDTGRDSVSSDCAGLGRPVAKNSINLDNYVLDPHASGDASLIE